MSAPTPLARWLKQRRHELDLTQEKLAEQLNCSVVTISKIEMGQRRPSKQIAELLAEKLRVPAESRADFLRFARGLSDIFAIPATSLMSRPMSARATLPIPAARLLGREHELRHMASLLDATDCRLITLTGSGGVGKTRLALEVGHRHTSEFNDGAVFVALAGVANAADVPSAIATTLGLTLGSEEEVPAQLISFLRPLCLLLVLDNLEHVLADSMTAHLLAGLLAAAPSIKIIATSREPLGAPGEWTFRVQGLPVSSDDVGGGASATQSAVQLFAQAAQRIDRHFVLNSNDLTDIMRICHLVDGVPLAIELAAAWTSMLSLCEIGDEITRTLDFLAAPTPTLNERQRSIRAVFESSWRLLNPEDQRALAYLSVFRGGFTRQAAVEAMAIPLAQLAALVGKSLICRDRDGRYDLHELVRQFAAEKLAKDATTERVAREVHAHFFLAILNEAAPKLRSADQDATLQRLVIDVDNLRAAWDRAVTFGWLDEINAAMHGLAQLYLIKAWNGEGVQRFGAAAALRGDVSTAHLLAYQSWFYACMAETVRGLQVLDEVYARIEGSNDPHLLIEPYLFRALVLYKVERFDEAATAMHIVVRLAQQINNRWFEGIAAHALAYNAFLRDGETADSFTEVLRAAQMVRDEGDLFQAVNLLQSAGHIAITAGRFDDAERLLDEIGEITERLGNAYAIGGIEIMRGHLARARGKHDRARQHLTRSLVLFQESRALKQAAEVQSLLDSLSAPSANT